MTPLTVCSLLGASVHVILQARILEWVATSFSGDLPNPGIETESPTLLGSLPSEPPGKPHQNTLICSNASFPIAPRNDRKSGGSLQRKVSSLVRREIGRRLPLFWLDVLLETIGVPCK